MGCCPALNEAVPGRRAGGLERGWGPSTDKGAEKGSGSECTEVWEEKGFNLLYVICRKNVYWLLSNNKYCSDKEERKLLFI